MHEMNTSFSEHFLPFFPLFFISLWFIITSLLGFFSGWYSLMRKYPNRNESALLQLKHLSGLMGFWVGLNNVLNISVCPSGVRIGIMRVFGIFCRDFFAPWEEIRVERKNRFFGQVAELQFGNPILGRLSISAHIADRLGRSSMGRWPEAGAFPVESNCKVLISIFKEWAFITSIAALFFILAPRIVESKSNFPPISVAILFPAIFFGVVSLFRYFDRIKK